MEIVTHTYLTKLKIISKIPVNGRLDITQNDLNIYEWSIMNWLWRKTYSDSKYNATKYLIDLYREINSFSEQLMLNISSENIGTYRQRKLILLVSLTEKIKQSITGIRNLMGTYKGYLKVVSQLECLEQDIIIPQYNTLKAFIPEELHTTILKTPIMQVNFTAPRDIPSTSPARPSNSPVRGSPVWSSHDSPVRSSHDSPVRSASSAPVSIPSSSRRRRANSEFSTPQSITPQMLNAVELKTPETSAY